ncbi:hypothetical protein C5167_025225 [Papaver somniferum]|uniref:Uncharacterized protein n=1 Tax=Papaver somniferum TaxID=3469 RepID=A0A4Y7JSF9_PAPSO|nr:hypothetical protein C5167_025225 [Papaver somniferum]
MNRDFSNTKNDKSRIRRNLVEFQDQKWKLGHIVLVHYRDVNQRESETLISSGGIKEILLNLDVRGNVGGGNGNRIHINLAVPFQVPFPES